MDNQNIDPLLLSCITFKKFLSKQIDIFLEMNNTPGVSQCTIWESMLAYLRGQIISYMAYENKRHMR